MRKYQLASTEARDHVDLRDYDNMICEAVHEVMPHASVVVEQFSYSVDPSPSKGEAIRIGRILSKGENLGSFCILVPKLFFSDEVLPKKANTVNDMTKTKDDDDENHGSGGNSGTMIVDATCSPSNIRYPQDSMWYSP